MSGYDAPLCKVAGADWHSDNYGTSGGFGQILTPDSRG